MFENTPLWAISALGQTQLATLERLLIQERASQKFEQYADYNAGPVADAERAYLPIKQIDNVAVITLYGVMLKSYPWPSRYVASSEHVRIAVRAARLDSSIEHIIVLADTPGGDVRGMHELGDEIAAAAKEKNTIVQVQGALCSAGYHVAAQANAIYASHRMNSIGSIGVRTVLWDSQKMYEDAGIKVIKIDTGEHKSTGLEGVEVTEPQIAEVQRLVDELYQEFLKVIQSGRNITNDEVKALADGRIWFASDAKKHKLIDAIQPLESTLAALSKSSKPKLTRAQAAALFSSFDA